MSQQEQLTRRGSTLLALDEPRVGPLVADLWALTKPGILVMCVVTTAAGMMLAPGPIDLLRALIALVGTAMAVGSANALNMYLEREGDKLMQRTRKRPLPTGRLRPRTALIFGLALGALSFVVLWTMVNPLSALLAALALDTYVLLYTPLKRRTCLALFVGTVPGAIPALIGWTAMTGNVGAPGVTLTMVLVLWQIPHFIAIALYRGAEYHKAGIPVLPMQRGDTAARRQAIFYTLLLLPASLLLVALGVASWIYLAAAAVAGGLMAVSALRHLRPEHAGKGARRFFLTTLLYLPLLTVGLVLDVLLR